MRPHLLLDNLRQIAAVAGDAILGFYRQDTPVTVKADNSPVTAADRASHDVIVSALGRLTPEWPVVSEEGEGVRGSARGFHWLVDPLDGTKEFVKRGDEFTVNIALIEDGHPVVGVVYAPALGLTYYAARGFSAWKQQGNAAAMQLQTRKADRDRLCFVASRDHAGPQVAALIQRAPTAELRSVGSSLKFCLVAEGAADLYLRDVPTMEWDTAAAQCVVEAAGGSVRTLEGRTLTYGKESLKNPSLVTLGDAEFPWDALLAGGPGEGGGGE